MMVRCVRTARCSRQGGGSRYTRIFILSNRSAHALVAVAGGMIAIGGEDEGAVAAELFDEESRRWLALPHQLAVPRDYRAHVVSWPHAAQQLHENDVADLQ